MTFLKSFVIIVVFSFIFSTPLSAKDIQVGIYGLAPWGDFEEGAKVVSGAGFRLAHTEAKIQNLNILHSKGMKGLVALGLNKTIYTNDALWAEFLIKTRSKLMELKGHPAIYAWYVIDEPGGPGMEGKLMQLKELIRSIDPATPLMAVMNNPKTWSRYLRFFDIIAIDPYLRAKSGGGYESTDVVYTWITTLKRDLRKLKLQKSVYVILGVFGYTLKEPGIASPYKKPSPAELDIMVNFALQEKVDGILLYTLALPESTRIYSWNLSRDDKDLWNAVQQVPSRIANTF